mmetsp:Transcript_36385/g.85076  ORF Transcript_36385/g.85076 Transcript_36385/m.85076 type:complete len:123 (-) Transcript_36385:799-1167(-)
MRTLRSKQTNCGTSHSDQYFWKIATKCYHSRMALVVKPASSIFFRSSCILLALEAMIPASPPAPSVIFAVTGGVTKFSPGRNTQSIRSKTATGLELEDDGIIVDENEFCSRSSASSTFFFIS